MAGIVNVSLDHDVRVPLVWHGGAGLISPAPSTPATASSDNTAVATVAVASDNSSVMVTSLSEGTCNITATADGLSDSVVVNVVASSVSGLVLSANNAELVAKGTPAGGRPPPQRAQSEHAAASHKK